MSLLQCPSCNAQVSNDARTCPHCGKMLMKNVFLGTWASFITSIALFAIGGLLIAVNDSKAHGKQYIIRTINGMGAKFEDGAAFHMVGPNAAYYAVIVGQVLCWVGIALFLASLGIWLYRRFK